MKMKVLKLSSILRIITITRRCFTSGLCGDNFTNQLIKGPLNVVMLRHGESEWDKKDLFCGWYNAPLSSKGRREALGAAKILKNACFKFDVAYCSVLSRATETVRIMIDYLNVANIPVIETWHFNEQHYGAITGLSYEETAVKFGEDQVRLWRCNYYLAPPPIKDLHPFYKQIINDPIYKCGPPEDDFPRNESLSQTIVRALPVWKDEIAHEVSKGKTVLIVAHENSLKGIIKFLDKIPDDEISELNVPPGIPFVYTLHCQKEKLCVVPNGSFQCLDGSPQPCKNS